MTCREKLKLEHPGRVGPVYVAGCDGCPDNYGYLPRLADCKEGGRNNCVECWDREIPGTENTNRTPTLKGSESPNKAFSEPEHPRILDSGDRTEFASGAVRDMREGKGRCDLLPLDVVADYLTNFNALCWSLPIKHVSDFQKDGNTEHLLYAIRQLLMVRHGWELNAGWMFLEVAKHFEEGAKKYGEYNWQKGIPTHCYIDSAVRHYLKWLRGDKDEPHDRAFVWNILCCIWTCKHKPELNDYGKGGEG